jgi:CheY-like chemotaxis protein
MNGVIGMTDLLLRTDLTPVQRNCAETVRTSGEALLGLINSVLDFSKIEAGQLALEAVAFDLDTVVARVVAPFHGLTAERGIAIETHVAADVPRRLVGDPHRLSQVLTNLLGNAVKFTEHGQVGLCVALAPTQVVPEGGPLMLEFEVEDTGPGIPADQQERIFDAFSQADGSTTRRYGGTGLGLAIARQICGLMGGTIGVSSEAGRGATFRFTAGFARQPEPAPRRPRLPPQAYHYEPDEDEPTPAMVSAHVLLVEDNRVNLQVGLGMLSRIGCTVETASDGRQALERFAPGRFDLVLMDCQMPLMDGFETTAAIRAREAGEPRTPVIALTANAIGGDRERCLAAGMDDYLPKPFRLAELRRLVTRWAAAPARG